MERKLRKSKRKHSQLKSYLATKPSSTVEQPELFVQASCYPRFFDENLLDNDRHIKVFKDNRYAYEIIFYYQLLKLIFETEDEDYQSYLQKIYDLIDDQEFTFYVDQNVLMGGKHQNYSYIVPQQDNNKLKKNSSSAQHHKKNSSLSSNINLSPSKVKKMITQFLQELGECQNSVNESLLKYPVMQQLLIIFVRSILINAGVCESFEEEVSIKEMYQCLASYFEIGVTFYESCVQFTQTDIFVYCQEREEVYMCYIDSQEYEEEEEDNIQSRRVSSRAGRQRDNNDQYQSKHYTKMNGKYGSQNDEEQVFNISSVKQMISEIDIPIESTVELRHLTRNTNQEQLLTQGQIIEYQYSKSNNAINKRKSSGIYLHSNSDLKLSHLVNDSEHNIPSCKNHPIEANLYVLSDKTNQKRVIFDRPLEKKTNNNPLGNFKLNFEEIQEVSPQQQNIYSPYLTPRNMASGSPKYQSNSNIQKLNIQQSVHDINQLPAKKTLSLYRQLEPLFNQAQIPKKVSIDSDFVSTKKKGRFRDYSQEDVEQNRAKMIKYLIYKGSGEEESVQSAQKRCSTVESIYFRSVNTINQLESQSIISPDNYLEQKIRLARSCKRQSGFNPNSCTPSNQKILEEDSPNTNLLKEDKNCIISELMTQKMIKPTQNNIIPIKGTDNQSIYTKNNKNIDQNLFFKSKYNISNILDISKDFTNSVIIKQMKEPFQSNIHSMKQRQRRKRDNIKQMIL